MSSDNKKQTGRALLQPLADPMEIQPQSRRKSWLHTPTGIAATVFGAALVFHLILFVAALVDTVRVPH